MATSFRSANIRPASFALRCFCIAGILAPTFLVGCESTGAAADHSPPGTPPTASGTAAPRPAAFTHDDPAYAKFGYRRDWTGFPFVSGGGVIEDLVPAGDGIIVQESGSTVTLLNANTGAVRWSNSIAGPLTKFVGNARVNDAARGDTIQTSSESELYVLASATGGQLDRQRFSRVVNTNPLYAAGVALYGTPTGELLAHNFDYGFKPWGFDTGSSIDFPPVAVSENIVGVVNRSGSVLFMNVQAGVPLGRARMWAGTSTAPVASDGLLIIAGLDQSIYAFAPDGQTIWRVRTSRPLELQPVVADSIVYVSRGEEGLTALEAGTGKIVWTAPGLQGVVIASRKTTLVVRTSTGVAVVDRASGDIISQIPLPGVIDLVVDNFADGNIYMVTNIGTVVKLIPRD
jgi:outer membrane protein assembly factor BamB